MRSFVTGALGTLGIPLTEALRLNGDTVLGFDIRHGAALDVVRGDVAEHRQLMRAIESFRPDVIFHFAGEFGRVNGLEFYEQMWRTNVLGTRNVLEARAALRCNLVFASSSEAYGDLGGLDAVDGVSEAVLEERIPKHHNEYALSKYTNERQIGIARREKQDNGVLTSVRICNTYGPGEHFSRYRSVVCQFLHRMLADQPLTVYRSCKRSFLYVDDLIRTLVKLSERQPVREMLPAYNISGQPLITMADLAERCQALIPESKSTVTYKNTESSNVPVKFLSAQNAAIHLDHAQKVDLDEGLRRTLAWMRAEREFAVG